MFDKVPTGDAILLKVRIFQILHFYKNVVNLKQKKITFFFFFKCNVVGTSWLEWWALLEDIEQLLQSSSRRRKGHNSGHGLSGEAGDK